MSNSLCFHLCYRMILCFSDRTASDRILIKACHKKKNNKRLLAVLTMVLFSIISFAQGVNLADGVEPLPADAETPGSGIYTCLRSEFNERMAPCLIKVWRYCTRRPKVTWARFLSNSPGVALWDGNLVHRAIPNSDESKKMMWKCFQSGMKPVRALPFALVV